MYIPQSGSEKWGRCSLITSNYLEQISIKLKFILPPRITDKSKCGNFNVQSRPLRFNSTNKLNFVNLKKLN